MYVADVISRRNFLDEKSSTGQVMQTDKCKQEFICLIPPGYWCFLKDVHGLDYHFNCLYQTLLILRMFELSFSMHDHLRIYYEGSRDGFFYPTPLQIKYYYSCPPLNTAFVYLIKAPESSE